MKITLVQIDKTDVSWLKDGISLYEERLKHYVSFEALTIVVPKQIRSKSIDEQKKEEALLLFKQLEKFDLVALLDENGSDCNSLEFSHLLRKYLNSGIKQLCFVIGGPYGFSEEIKAKYATKLRLSSMTFSHQMIRLLFVEQLYRGFTLLKGEKYHHT